MEDTWSWRQKALISELVQGMELAKQLRLHLNATSSVETRDMLLQRIVSSYEKALLILGGTIGSHPPSVGAAAAVPESPGALNESPTSDELDGVVKDDHCPFEASKKRKTTPRWTEQVRVNPENGLEGLHDDGYSWRKYGQKDILGAKYPRSYYRCTYRNTQNCWATKQVQRSDEDPTIFDITYRGVHTCANSNQSVARLTLPENQESKENIINNNYPNQQPQEALLQLQTSLKVDTKDLDNKEKYPFSFPSTHGYVMSMGSYSPPFVSPATSEPKYNPVSSFQMNHFGALQNLQHSDSDFTEIISAATSTTNSPIVDLDFSIDPSELDTHFPFDHPGFFS